MIATVSCGLRSASSPTFCIDWACTWPCTCAMSIIVEVWVEIGRASADRRWIGDTAAGGRRSPRRARRPRLGRLSARGGFFRREDAANQRPHHEQQHDQAEQHHHGELDAAHDVVLGELQEVEPAGRLLDRRLRRFGEAQIDDLDLVAALLVEADRGAHQRGDAVELFLGARLVDDLALVVLARRLPSTSTATEMRLTRPPSMTSVLVVREIS